MRWRRPGGPRGLTYIEMVMVVALVAVATAVVLPTGLTVRRTVRERQLRRSLAEIRAAIDAYHCDWIRGCIESEDETGWPRDLEELHEGVEFSDDPECQQPCGTLIHQDPAGSAGEGEGEGGILDQSAPDDAPALKVYLKRVPQDPFNRRGDEHDTMGWLARAYEDEPDDSWGGENVYDVRSGSDEVARDGTEYATW